MLNKNKPSVNYKIHKHKICKSQVMTNLRNYLAIHMLNSKGITKLHKIKKNSKESQRPLLSKKKKKRIEKTKKLATT